jgi:hypothetical protein
VNDANDSLEAELSALRPREVSPRLRLRVAERLVDSPRSKRRRLWRMACAGGLAAACLTAVLFPWEGSQRIERKAIVGLPEPPLSVEVEDAGPTLMAYQQAFVRSPEALDALLDKDAMIAPEPNPELVRICDFTRSDAALRTLLGED